MGTLDIGVSGLIAFQRALTTTGQNIANVNTAGYSRQTLELSQRTPEFTGQGFIGTGVQLDGIRRVVDQFVIEQVQTSTATLARLDTFFELSATVDDLLADPETGLTPRIEEFFNAAQDVANDPSSIPARQVLLSEGQSLTDAFQSLEQRLFDLDQNVDTIVNTTITEINGFAQAIAEINQRIAESPGAGSIDRQPNDLLDQRDQLLRELAERVDVRTVQQDDGALNVFIGNGQALVVGVNAAQLTTVQNQYDPTRDEIGLNNGSVSAIISDQIAGGSLGGALDFRDRIRDPAVNALGRLAVGIAETFNAQHQLGQDLDGNLGGNFFTPINSGQFVPFVQDSNTNNVLGTVTAQYGNVADLTTSDYILRYNGGTSYTLTRQTDQQAFNFSGGPGAFTSPEIDGLVLSINPGLQSGSTVQIQPTALATQLFDVNISNAREIAAALPVRTTNNTATNTGTGVVSAGSILDQAAYIPDNYTVILADDSGATADGVIGTITDAGGTDNTLEYQLTINGVNVYTQTEADAPLADLTALRDAINGAANANIALTGVQAYVDTANNRLYLANSPASRQDITVSESLNDSGAANVEAADSVTGYFGSVLTGDGTTTTVSNTLPVYDNAASGYIILDAAGNTEASGTYTAGSNITFNGIQFSINGQPNLGDTFSIQPNTSGVSDNRNALLLAGLQFQQTLNGNNATYLDTYGQLVANVGTTTRQAEVTRQAQDALLQQAIDRRESVSGVNLDEEAANLVRFQQAFQASAQVIAAADTLFQTLIAAIAR